MKTLITTLTLLIATVFADETRIVKLKAQYDNAVKKQAYMEEINLYKIINEYGVALEKYRKTVEGQLAFSSDLSRLKAIQEEEKVVLLNDGKNLPEITKGGDTYLKKLRANFIAKRNRLFKNNTLTRGVLKKTLIKELVKLEQEFIANNDIDCAFKAKEMRDEITSDTGTKDIVATYKPTDYEVSANELSVGIEATNFPAVEGWRWAHSKQTVKLEEGKKYVFSVMVIGDELTDVDKVPGFTPKGQVTWEGVEALHDKFVNEYRFRKVKVRGGKFGWKQVTVTFVSPITMEVDLRLATYQKNQQFFKHFSLKAADNPEEEMITLDLTLPENWKDYDKMSFRKGVNKAGK